MRNVLLLVVVSLLTAGPSVANELPVVIQSDAAAGEPVQLVDIQPIYDLTRPDEPMVGCLLVYQYLPEDAEEMVHFQVADYTMQVVAFGGWGTHQAVLQIVRDHNCQISP